MRLRALDPVRDRTAAAAVWAEAFGATWPVLPRALERLPGGYVAEADGEVLGLVGVDLAGSVPLIMVRPQAQRRGIGTALMGAALERLGAAGVERVGLASGGPGYIWPGVPRDLPGAVAFFARTGWHFDDEPTHDMVRSLHGYATPPGEPARRAGVFTEVLPEARRAEVFGFVDEHFPYWSEHFRDPVEHVLVARSDPHGVVGALLLEGPRSTSVLVPMLGADMGTIGCVGVAEPHRGRRIGTAMVAAASETLRNRGVDRCHIGWTVAVDFYAGLGYQVWRTYLMSRRRLRPVRLGEPG